MSSRVQALIIFSLSWTIEFTLCSYWHPNPVPYIGDYFKEKNISDIEFCNKPICISDASRMGLWINENANPCDNFYRYVCGSLLTFQAQNERYPFQGLQQILYETIYEQRRKVLAEPVQPHDNRPQVLAKMMFQKCLDSRHIKSNGKVEMLEFLEIFKGFPMYESITWNALQFNKSEVFEKIPHIVLEFFFMEFKVTKIGANNASNNLVFHNHLDFYLERMFGSIKRMVQEFGVPQAKHVETDLEALHEFLRDYGNTMKLHKTENLKTKMTLKDFNQHMNSELSMLNVNWTQIVISSLSFPVDETFEIVVRNLKLVKELIKILDLLDNRTFANFLASQILLEFKDTVLVYFVSPSAEAIWGVARSFQRFEQCNKIVQEYLPVALTSLTVRRFAKLDVIDAAYEVANRTIGIIINEVETDESVPKHHRDFLVSTIRSMNLILGYPKELLEEGKIEKVYEKLNLKGSENLIEMVFEGFKFKKDEKFRNMIKEDNASFKKDQSAAWTDYTTEDEYVTPLYLFLDENTIYYPTLWFQNPYFHPNRPRFYKDSMFGAFLSYTIAAGINEYLERNEIPSKNGKQNHFDFINSIYENYAKWDDETSLDPPLPGFLFSNKQMFWFTLIHKNCIKLQTGFTQEFNDEKNAEAYFHLNPTFHQSFGCNFNQRNLSETQKSEEIKSFNEFY